MEQTNTTTENSEGSSSSNNISIPQLTDARKQEIRKKLLERQRQSRLQNSNRNADSPSKETPSSSSSGASSSNSLNNITTTTTTTTNNTNTNTTSDSKSKNEEDDTPPNQEMIKKAVTFLTSPKVQSAPTARKHSFLLSKGCTKKEIELAEKEIKEKGLLSNNDSSSTAVVPSYNTTTTIGQSQTPPPLPPRTYQNIQIIYRNPPLTRLQKVKRGLFIILFGASIIKGISILVKNEIMRPLRELYKQYTQYLKSRNNVLNKYMIQVIEYCALFINDKNKDKVKGIKTIEEIEKGKEKAITEKKEGKEEEEEEKTEDDESMVDNKKEGDNDSLSEEKVRMPKERKAIKLKIHRKKKENEEEEESSVEEKQLVKKEADTTESTVRTLPAAVQEYIDQTNTFHSKCKDAIDTYAYDLERNSDLFSGSLGQTMKISSEVYQIVSREMFYISSSYSSFYLDPYHYSISNGDNSVSLYSRVNNIKSDIRRLKGMLLNHRNFPKYKQRASSSS